jgi:cell division protein FtsB
MTQQKPPATVPVQLTVEDMQELIQTDETSRLKVQGIALQRRVNELEAENAELKAQIAEPDTTTTNNKNDSKLTAVGAD